MSTFAQEADRDFTVVNGKLQLVSDVNQATAIKLRNRFLFVKGEWWLDTRIGVPYYDFIWGIKNPDLQIIKSIFTSVCKSVPTVAKVLGIDLDFDRADRQLTSDFTVSTTGGATLTGSPDVAFVVQP